MTDIPHLSLPLRLIGEGLAVVDQDTVEELANNVLAITSYAQGDRDDDDRFGISPLVFGTIPLNLTDIEATIAIYEPRASVNVYERPLDPSDPTADRVSIEVTMPGDATEEVLMPEYVDLELQSDPEVMGDEAKTFMAENLPGWVARPGNVETILIESSAYMEAELIEQASVVSPYLFSWLGRSLYGIAPYEAQASTGSAAFVFATTASAQMLVEGTLIAVPHPSGEQILFSTDTDITAPAGGGTVTVNITAEEPGTQANGCFGDAQMIELVDGVASVRVDQVTGGGVDPEDEDAYLDRLTSALTLLSPRPILPQDFALLALQDPRVERAMAIDLFQPPATSGAIGGPPWGGEPNGTTNVPRCVTVAIKPVGSDTPSTQLMTDIWTALDSLREVNFLTYVGPPKVTAVDVKLRVKPQPGTQFAAAQQSCADELALWLDPSTWGPAGTGQDWIVDATIRINEAIEWANRAAGVWWVDQVQVRLSGGSWSSVDITLPGIAPLPKAGVILPNITQAP